jgi:hypothetical protein
MAEALPPQQRPKSRSLFHYTTAQGLLGIIKDRCLFATHADFSNDPSECRLILPYLTKVIAEEYEELITKLIAAQVRQDGCAVPYIALYEGLQRPLPIKAVIVGPHAQQENQRVAVELLLERCKINANVRVSGTPFRE